MLSFYKAPIKFVKEFNKIQSDFLWGRTSEKRKVHWDSWRDVCLLIDNGGLGIKRTDDFNMALLSK